MARVLIIDDNETMREGLAATVRRMGHEAFAARSGAEGLAYFGKHGADFVITDLKMEGTGGLDVVKAIQEADPGCPTMIVTAFGTVETAVEAMRLGAFDFLQKPFNDQALLDSIFAAIRKHEEICTEKERRAEEEQNLASLTSREREVLELLRAGKSSKVIAADLDISVRTVEGHRANIMLKMNAKTVGQLIDLASKRDSAPG